MVPTRVYNYVLIFASMKFSWIETCLSSACSFSLCCVQTNQLINHNKPFILNFQVTELTEFWSEESTITIPPYFPPVILSDFIIHVKNLAIWHSAASSTFGFSLVLLMSCLLTWPPRVDLSHVGITACLTAHIFPL